VSNDLTAPPSAFIDAVVPIAATEDGVPCKSCELQITDPGGKKLTGQTDDNGKFNLPLSLQGTYSISLLKGGQVVKTVQVKALPKAPAEGGTTPTMINLGALLPFAILALLILIAIVAYLMSKGKKK
jgi:hypothetical protein